MKKILVHLQSWYGCYVLLFLLIITSLLWSWHGSGRYQSFCDIREKIYVIDTKTSQIWSRDLRRNIDFGTNEKPQLRLIEMPKPQSLSSEEINW